MPNLPKSVPPKPGTYTFTTNARAGPGPSTMARGATAKVQGAVASDTKDKEEGEISDEDDGAIPDNGMESHPRPSTPPRRMSAKQRHKKLSPSVDKHPSRRAKSSSQPPISPRVHSLPPRPPNVFTPPLKPPPSLPSTPEDPVRVRTELKVEDERDTEMMAEDSGAEQMRSSPGLLSPAPASISVEEARQYMDIIRNLLQEGCSPADLIRRGATARYVTAVCEDIVASAKKRDVVSSSPAPVASRRQGSRGRPAPNGSLQSPPGMARNPSLGSETSEERLVDLLMGPASPISGPSKMDASSSWHPANSPLPPPPPLDDYPLQPPPPPLRIESYRPPTPPGRAPPNAPTSLSSNGSASSTTLTATMRNFYPLSSYSGSVSPVPPPSQNPYLPPTQNPYLPAPPSSIPQQNPYLAQLAPPPPPPQQNPYLIPSPGRQPNSQLFAHNQPQHSQPNHYHHHHPPSPPHSNPYLPALPNHPPPQNPNPYAYPQQQAGPPSFEQNSYQPPPPLANQRPSLPPKPMPATSAYGMPPRSQYVDGSNTENSQNGYNPMSLPAPYIYSDHPTPEPLPSPRMVEADLAARTALLETRRKAFESMKRRREANRPAASAPPAITPEVPQVIDLTLDDDVSIIVDEDDDDDVLLSPGDKTIEEQMAELEHEVMGLQTEQAVAESRAMQDDVDMDMESTEDGEIEDDTSMVPTPTATTPTLTIPSLALSPSTTPAVKIPRGMKRANAEDMMDNRPTTLPARVPPNKRRSLFGGMPQRPNRLVMLLDHSDSDSDDDDDPDRIDRMARLKINSGTVTPISETALLLAEKEEGIRKLREQIEKRMKARIVKKAPGEKAKVVKEIEVAETVKSEVQEPVQPSEDVVMAESSDAPAAEDVAVKVIIPSDTPADTPSDVLPPAENLEITSSLSLPSESVLARASQQTPNSHFRLYSPLLPRYPQLRMSTSSLLVPRPANGEAQNSLARASGEIDQNLLASLILTRRLKKEPEAMLCAAETAGGSCADASCGDIHLVKGTLSDKDLAEYLSHIHPGKSIGDILVKLGEARSAILGLESTSRTGRSSTRSMRSGLGGKCTAPASTASEHTNMVNVQELLARVDRQLTGE